MGRLVRAGEVARDLVWLLPAPLAFAEDQRPVVGHVQVGQLVLEDQPAAVLGCVGVRGSGVYVRLVDGDHPVRSAGGERRRDECG
jgi:hypothetical protein